MYGTTAARREDNRIQGASLPSRGLRYIREDAMERLLAMTLPKEGADYIYVNSLPTGCSGQRYRVHKIVLDVPSYQKKVLVEALSGVDKGLWFTCSIANFTSRYRPAEEGMVADGI